MEGDDSENPMDDVFECRYVTDKDVLGRDDRQSIIKVRQ